MTKSTQSQSAMIVVRRKHNMTLEEAKILLAKLELLNKLQNEANNSKNIAVIKFVTKFTQENN